MLYGIMSEQDRCRNVRDIYSVSERITIFYMLPYKYIVNGA